MFFSIFSFSKNSFIKKLFFLAVIFFSVTLQAQKPKVWIYTDMTDPTIKGNNHMGTVNDPDDVSAMGGYLLLANMFDTKGIVVASTHRKEHKTSGNQAAWANAFFGTAYNNDVIGLNEHIGGYPETINLIWNW